MYTMLGPSFKIKSACGAVILHLSFMCPSYTMSAMSHFQLATHVPVVKAYLQVAFRIVINMSVFHTSHL